MLGTSLETTAPVLAAARVTVEREHALGVPDKKIANPMSKAPWVFTLNQTAARASGSKVTAQHLRRTQPLQPVAVPPTSQPSYMLRLLSVAARSHLHRLPLARALIRALQPKPL